MPEPRTRTVSCCLSQGEYDRLKEFCDLADMSISNFLREGLKSILKEPKQALNDFDRWEEVIDLEKTFTAVLETVQAEKAEIANRMHDRGFIQSKVED
jgi:hypothetical protein